jgi:hypothetical protein
MIYAWKCPYCGTIARDTTKHPQPIHCGPCYAGRQVSIEMIEQPPETPNGKVAADPA